MFYQMQEMASHDLLSFLHKAVCLFFCGLFLIFMLYFILRYHLNGTAKVVQMGWGLWVCLLAGGGGGGGGAGSACV